MMIIPLPALALSRSGPSLVKDIIIRGTYPLFESDILKVMTLAPGDVFTQEQLPEQEKWIREFLNAEGYLSPSMDISAVEDPEDGHRIVHVNLNKGPPTLFQHVSFDGNHNFSDLRLRLMMKSAALFQGIPYRRFVEGDFMKDMRTLTDFYRRKGFGDCEIGYEKTQQEGSQISVVVKINEGPFYEISFSGNKQLSRRSIKKNMVFFKNGNSYDIGIRKIQSQILGKYKEKGFSNTTVSIEEKTPRDENAKKRQVSFIIHEGVRRGIDSLAVSGNSAVKTSKIKKQMMLKSSKFYKKHYYSKEVLEEDIQRVKALYRKNGFMQVEIIPSVSEASEKSRVSLHLDIHESSPTLISSLGIEGLSAIPMEKALTSIAHEQGGPFQENMVKSDENILSALISEKGYPYAKVAGDSVLSKDGKTAELLYRVDQGSLVRMGTVHFSGNLRTREKAMLVELDQKTGDSFSLKKMLSGQKNLRDMDIFKSVSFQAQGLEEKKDEIDLLVGLEEKKPYYFEMGAGYETRDGLFLNTKAGDINLFGLNKNVWLGADISQAGNRLETGYEASRFLGTRTSMNSSLFHERTKAFNQNFGTEIIGANLGLTRKISRKTLIGLNLSFEQRDQFGSPISPELYEELNPDEFKPRTLFTLTPSLVHDRRDSFIKPKRGLYSNVSVDLSKGLVRSLDDFIKYRLDMRYYLSPTDRMTLAWTGRWGHISPFGSGGDVPSDQLFFLGGATTVRGFDENLLSYDELGNALGGQTTLSSSLEARMDLGRNFELPLFLDMGKISNTVIPGAKRGFRYSVGSGIRYNTPIGPMGLVYGRNLNPGEGEAKGKIHFSIGYSF
ncbi:MAG: outer membrane protein assembly factor BamA [Proteobacteria bacterium]|nr:outer membrane protein assembly factor BamA [Pseudomonadota bacterium]MBU4468885.1 outer membrane protein assembly factor BamA [Pseudomonadota bacterium]MCG2750878.1 outer membrane protein assembly factor BamA [Desulfobacteraceae bacterium]